MWRTTTIFYYISATFGKLILKNQDRNPTRRRHCTGTEPCRQKLPSSSPASLVRESQVARLGTTSAWDETALQVPCSPSEKLVLNSTLAKHLLPTIFPSPDQSLETGRFPHPPVLSWPLLSLFKHFPDCLLKESLNYIWIGRGADGQNPYCPLLVPLGDIKSWNFQGAALDVEKY